MIRTLKKINIAALFVYGFNVAVILAGVFVYLYGPADFVAEYFTAANIMIACLVLIVITLLFTLIAGYSVFSRRSRNDLVSAEVIGDDIKEAYNYGMVGMMVVDENFIVIWQSDFILSRGINLLDQNILDWQRSLTSLVNLSQGDLRDPENDFVNITHNDRIYQVKHISEAGLFIFKDITQNEYLYEKIEQRSLVIGIAVIDNYTDISANREMNNPLTAMVTSAIFAYGQKNGFLVRRYRDDAFSFVGDYQHFENLIKDKFSIVEKVRNMEVDQESPFTISMSFAYNFPDAVKLNEMAVSAIDLAMSRGGDQVVVSKYGEEHQYFGGASVATAKQNKVKVRLTADTFNSLIQNASNVIIMGHANADLDAIGSALGAKAMCDYIRKKEAERTQEPYTPSLIVYDQKSVENKTKQAVTSSFSKEEEDHIFIHPRELISGKRNQLITPSTLLLIVDVSRPKIFMAPGLEEHFSKVAVIDHHRRTEDFITNPVFQYIEPSASSTSELITELIEYGNFPNFELPASYATMMLAGIYLDTNYFRSNTTGVRTFEAAMILKEHGADNGMADEFLKDEYEEVALINRIMAGLKTIALGVIVAKSDQMVDAATLAKVANKCLQIKGVSAVFVIGGTAGNETRVSARSDGSINVQLIMEKLGGGGHQASAAAQFKDEGIDVVEQKIEETVARYLSEARVNEKK